MKQSEKFKIEINIVGTKKTKFSLSGGTNRGLLRCCKDGVEFLTNLDQLM